MSWLRPRRALIGGAALAIACACALPASAPGAGPTGGGIKNYRVAIPLPRARHGTVRLLKATVKMPSNMSVKGSPFLYSVLNGQKLPCYIRASAATVPTSKGVWHIYVAINAPKGLVQCRVPAAVGAAAAKLDLNVGVVAPLSQYPTSVQEAPGDACQGLRDEDKFAIWFALVAAEQSEAREVAIRAMAADALCKKK